MNVVGATLRYHERVLIPLRLTTPAAISLIGINKCLILIQVRSQGTRFFLLDRTLAYYFMPSSYSTLLCVLSDVHSRNMINSLGLLHTIIGTRQAPNCTSSTKVVWINIANCCQLPPPGFVVFLCGKSHTKVFKPGGIESSRAPVPIHHHQGGCYACSDRCV